MVCSMNFPPVSKSALRWVCLVASSIAAVVLLETCRLPAALLLGPMFAAVIFAVRGQGVRIPNAAFIVAQGLIGCMIARTLRLSIVTEIAHAWPMFLMGILSVVAISTLLGWVMTRLQVLPGTTALWGSSPGAAGVMVIMAEAFGADMRLVAFMQYLRVVAVAIVASVVPLFWVHGASHASAHALWFPPVQLSHLAQTGALVALGYGAARRKLIPAAGLLVPMGCGAIAQDVGWIAIDLPPWLLAMAYATAGWSIGGRFSPDILHHALRALPKILLSIGVLIGLCGGMAAGLVTWGGIDPLTAYLATSPGGADTVAIIAASAHADMPFIVAMQVGRFLVVMLTAPLIARRLARLHLARVKT